jgi:hypothetical protein
MSENRKAFYVHHILATLANAPPPRPFRSASFSLSSVTEWEVFIMAAKRLLNFLFFLGRLVGVFVFVLRTGADSSSSSSSLRRLFKGLATSTSSCSGCFLVVVLVLDSAAAVCLLAFFKKHEEQHPDVAEDPKNPHPMTQRSLSVLVVVELSAAAVVVLPVLFS